jgi:succinate-semialdehyde dehydrogenase/glutarate-semialdehyde dehydrogenase
VHEAISERFIEKFIEHTKSIRIGHGSTPDIDMGPVGSETRISAITDMISDAESKGAKVAIGGKKSDAFSEGFFFEPTVLLDVSSEMEVMKEEIFGPIAPITTFANVSDVIAKVNSTTFGLAGFIFTEDMNAAIEIGLQLEVGMIGVNNLTIATAEAPFGGVKSSGFGREGGSEGIEEFLVTKYLNARMKKVLV